MRVQSSVCNSHEAALKIYPRYIYTEYIDANKSSTSHSNGHSKLLEVEVTTDPDLFRKEGSVRIN